MNNTMRYKVSIIEFNGEGEDLKAQPRYEQTVDGLDIRAVVDAVNSWVPAPPVPTTKRTRAPRSDRGKKRSGEVVLAEQ